MVEEILEEETSWLWQLLAMEKSRGEEQTLCSIEHEKPG